ncbi:MAG: type II toxin-antitoxin system Phd/YefM family antitoxin [Chloroflexi bacterium]|nr:type II toxin-antitoxin system Phd/YefM family antitoxin [Chloroflexota bacterium]
MITISFDKVKHNLLKYLLRVEQGETLLILRDDKPIAEIKPVSTSPSQLRPFGLCAGEFVVPDDFDDSLPEHILQTFEG